MNYFKRAQIHQFYGRIAVSMKGADIGAGTVVYLTADEAKRLALELLDASFMTKRDQDYPSTVIETE